MIDDEPNSKVIIMRLGFRLCLESSVGGEVNRPQENQQINKNQPGLTTRRQISVRESKLVGPEMNLGRV